MKTNCDDAAWQVRKPDDAPDGVEADPATGREALRWSFEDQQRFGDAAVSAGLVTTAQRDVAIQHVRATGASIGHSLIHIGAITQRQLLMFLEQLLGQWGVAGK